MTSTDVPEPPATPPAQLPLARRIPWLVWFEWLLVFAAVVIHVGLRHPRVLSDGRVRYNTLLLFVHEGKISKEIYSILQSFLAVPFYYAGERLGVGGEVGVAHFNMVVFPLVLLGFYLLLRRHVPSDILRRTILLLLTASMFGRHLQSFYGEVFTAGMAMLGIAALVTDRLVLAGVFMTLGVINSPVAALGLVFCNGVWALRTRRFVQAAWPIALGIGFVMLEFWWRRGSPFRSGYEGDGLNFRNILPTFGKGGFSYPMLFGMFGLTLSFGKGILFYAPGLLLNYARYPTRDRTTLEFVRLSMAFSWGLLFAYSKWWAWNAGWFWGPRFLLFACVPASFALALHLSGRHESLFVQGLLIVAVAFSVWVGVDGAVFDQNGMGWCMKNHHYEPICWFTMEWSALFRPLYVTKDLDIKDYILMGHALVVAIVLLAPRIPRFCRDLMRAAISTARGKQETNPA